MNTQSNSALDTFAANAPTWTGEPYNLVFFVVSNDDVINGCRYQNYISPFFATLAQARDFKADALAQYPDCYCGGYEAYYQAENDSNRLELMAAIQHPN